MNTIPIRKTSEQFFGEIAMMRYFFEESRTYPSGSMHPHRDDYYIFLLFESGSAKMLIDFEEYEINGAGIFCIRPGQVHLPGGNVKTTGWFLAVDSMAVRDEYKEVFAKSLQTTNNPNLGENRMNDLRNCASVLYNRIHANNGTTGQYILRDLLSSYIGMIAEVYQEGLLPSANKRSALITAEFKTLLSINYRSMKLPSQYAATMNISSVYLYEAVKQTTGVSVSESIRNEIVLQAKRLLFYTDKSVKEIALELGYEDYAYFTRLFTNVSKQSPSQFRKQYLE